MLNLLWCLLLVPLSSLHNLVIKFSSNGILLYGSITNNETILFYPINDAKGQLRKADIAVRKTANSYFLWYHAPIDNIVIYLKKVIKCYFQQPENNS